MYYIKETKEFGRGLYASTNIFRRSVLTRCEILVLNHRTTQQVNDTPLKYYTFVYDSKMKRDCLVLGDGELFNHSDTPNVGYRLEPIVKDGRMLMVFWALKNINPDEQLFIDYNADVDVNVDEYIKQKSLV